MTQESELNNTQFCRLDFVPQPNLRRLFDSRSALPASVKILHKSDPQRELGFSLS
jgi:hypothetical protein